MLADHRDGLSSSSFFSLILDSSIGLSAGIQSAGDSVPETLLVRIMHAAEEENLSPFDSKISCLCQSIETNNNKHVCMYVCTNECTDVLCTIYIYICMCMYLCTLFMNFYNGIGIRTGSQLFNQQCQIKKMYVIFCIAPINFNMSPELSCGAE